MSLVEIFHEGGFIMPPLAIMLILAIAVFIDRCIGLFILVRDTKSIGRGGGTNNKYLNSFVGRYRESGSERERNLLLGELKRKLFQRLWMLATVASTAPFVGLFGTVVGIIKSFKSIAKASQAGFSVVAAELSEALIATGAGILVALVAVILFNFLRSLIVQGLDEFELNLEMSERK